MGSQSVTKADLESLRMALSSDIESLRTAIRAETTGLSRSLGAFEREFGLRCDLLLASMTIRFGVMLIVGLSSLFAALKLT